MAKSHQLVASANMLVVTDIALSPLVLPPARLPLWLHDPTFRGVIASEPLFDGNWNRFPEQSILSVGEDLEIQILNCKDVTNSVSTNTLEQRRQQLKQWLHSAAWEL